MNKNGKLTKFDVCRTKLIQMSECFYSYFRAMNIMYICVYIQTHPNSVGCMCNFLLSIF